MSNYFEDMLPAEELKELSYIPTLGEFVEWIEARWADLPALSDTVRTETYRTMCDHVARRRALLREKGLKEGDRVAILDLSTIEAVESFLAVTSAGMVAINLPASLPAPAVAGCCARFGVSLLVYGERLATAVEEAGCPAVPIEAMAEQGVAAVHPDKDAAAAIFFTGGTTGAPKGVVLPHRALMRGALNGCYAPGRQLGCNRYAHVLPLSHVFGLIRGTLSALYTGSLWVAAPDVKETLTKLPQIRPTCMVAVPGICEILMGLVKMYGKEFLGGQLRFIISGAANVPPKLIGEFHDIDVRLFAGYGMTEGANLTSGNIDVQERPTSVGKVYPHQETKIVDGELWMRGDNLFLGYYGAPELTAEVLTSDGWLRTGDLARFDDDGFLYIVGRIKNIIVLANGENVSPESIEELFYKDSCVKDCLVKEDTLGGRQVIAVEILPRTEMFAGQPQAEVEQYFNRLVDSINSSLPTTHRVSKVTVRTEDFKRTGAMKVSRNQ